MMSWPTPTPSWCIQNCSMAANARRALRRQLHGDKDERSPEQLSKWVSKLPVRSEPRNDQPQSLNWVTCLYLGLPRAPPMLNLCNCCILELWDNSTAHVPTTQIVSNPHHPELSRWPGHEEELESSTQLPWTPFTALTGELFRPRFFPFTYIRGCIISLETDHALWVWFHTLPTQTLWVWPHSRWLFKSYNRVE